MKSMIVGEGTRVSNCFGLGSFSIPESRWAIVEGNHPENRVFGTSLVLVPGTFMYKSEERAKEVLASLGGSDD